MRPIYNCSLCLLLVWTHIVTSSPLLSVFSWRCSRRPFFWHPRGCAFTSNCIWICLKSSLFTLQLASPAPCMLGEVGSVFGTSVWGTGYETELTPKPVENHRAVSIPSAGHWNQCREQIVCNVGRDWQEDRTVTNIITNQNYHTSPLAHGKGPHLQFWFSRSLSQKAKILFYYCLPCGDRIR